MSNTKIHEFTDFNCLGTLSCKHCLHQAKKPSEQCKTCARINGTDNFEPNMNMFTNIDINEMVSKMNLEQKKDTYQKLIKLLTTVTEQM